MRAPSRLWAVLLLLAVSTVLGNRCADANCSSFDPLPEFYVGNKASDSACTYDTIQAAISAATCAYGTNIFITDELSYTAQHLGISGKRVNLIGRAPGLHCGFIGPGSKPSEPALSSSTIPLETIDGAGHSGNSVIAVTGTSNVTLQNLLIKNGTLDSNGTGGGIYFDGTGSLKILNSTITLNHAGYGAGIAVKGEGGQATLTLGFGTIIYDNVAAVSGGGIRIEGTSRLLALSDFTAINSNQATTGDGGGIEILGPARADIGSPGYPGFGGVLSTNYAVNGGGVAVIDNGNGEAVLRMFAYGPTQTASTIQGNSASSFGGAIYLGGAADACLFAPDIESNRAPEGAAIYKDFNGITGNGTYINRGFPSRLGVECGPETVASLGGSTDCSSASSCNAINGNMTQNADGSFSAGSVIYDFGGELVGSRFRIQHSDADYAISARGGAADVSRCLITDNHVSTALIRADNNQGSATSFDECTFARNTIDGTYVFDFSYQIAPSLDHDIIYQPGHPSVHFIPTFPGDALNVSYTMSNDTSTLGPQSPSVVSGAPYFVDAANGDYHLDPFAQIALDFAPALGDTDLDGHTGWVDLPSIQNQFGAGDLGAYERQNLFYNCGTSDTLFCNGFDH